MNELFVGHKQHENSGQKPNKPVRAMLDPRIGFVQIEITTVCNFSCFYCAGREMPKRHMDMALFDEILVCLPVGRHLVSLQGEGEPTLHPSFWDMVKKVVKSGKYPYTITNCSNIDVTLTAQLFPQIGISLDTLNKEESERIGRFGLDRVLNNLEQLLSAMGPSRVIVHSVDYGQPLEAVLSYVKSLGINNHVVQPLQNKADYRKRYPELGCRGQEQYHFRCRYIFQPSMRFFDVNGRMMPCYAIKDTSKFVSIEHVEKQLLQRSIPVCCYGCREITMDFSQ